LHAWISRRNTSARPTWGLPNFSEAHRRNVIIQWGRKDVPLKTTARESLTGLNPETIRQLIDDAGQLPLSTPFIS